MFKKYLRKFGAILAMGLLAFGAVGFRAPTAQAQVGTPPAVQAQVCSADQSNDATEVKSAGADTDTVDLQCGDQSGADTLSAGPDTDTVQSGDQSGSQIEDGQPDLPGASPEASGQ